MIESDRPDDQPNPGKNRAGRITSFVGYWRVHTRFFGIPKNGVEETQVSL
jgi:hypothetical protein